VKQNSREDVNAWVYSFKLFPSKETPIHMTEGLLERFSEEEIKTIIYHELGHVKQKHGKYILSLTFLVAIAVSILMFFLRQVMLANGWWIYLAAFPIGVLALIIVAEWLPKKVSKMFEHKADAYVIEQTNEKDLYINTLRKLTEYSEEEDNHPRKNRDWNKTHPTLQKRINFIERTFRN
jgi:Zn-dependent protease with chaperone function